MPNRRAAAIRRATAIFAVLALGAAAPRLLAAAQATQAQPPSAAAPSPDLAGIAHVALRVNDLSASIAFYRKLGFVQAFALSRNGEVYEAFIKLNDRQFLELYPTTQKDPQAGFLHLCFEGASLQAVHDFYVAQGLSPTPVRTAGAGNLLFTIPGPQTPTGPQNMEYTQYMPGSLHSKDFGQHLGPDRVATQLISVWIAADHPAAAAAFYTTAGFVPADAGASPASRFTLPGAPDESVEIVPADSLGFKAHFTLKLAPGMGATALRARGISFLPIGNNLTLHDPDGNDIVLASH
jgi:catechol 2,3-dioxygenase-like lactoylglutathione lyase family enzyme